MHNKNKLASQRLMTIVSDKDLAYDEPSPDHVFNVKFSKDYLKDKKMLSIGPWTGLYESLIYNLPSSLSVVDIEKKALALLKKRLPRVEVKNAPSHNLPFSDSKFDVITCWAVLEHIPIGYELASIREMRRVIKKGGILFISTMNKSLYSDVLDPGYWLVGHRHYSEESLRLMLKDGGFETEALQKHGGFIVALDAIFFYICKHIFHITKPNFKFYKEKVINDQYLSRSFYEIAIRARAN